MTTKFPTPAELRAQQESDAEAQVTAAMETIERALRNDNHTISHSWPEPVRRVVAQRLAAAGWSAKFGSDQREGAWVTVTAASGSRESYPPRGGA